MNTIRVDGPLIILRICAGKELVSAELFLLIDPLVSLSTSIAARSWVWSLTAGAVILIVCVLIPRGFCGYICPLGTVIDLFDWSVARRVSRYQLPDNGWWVHIKYYLLAGTLVCALLGCDGGRIPCRDSDHHARDYCSWPNRFKQECCGGGIWCRV